MEVILASPRGFCAGVVRAIEVVEICLIRYGPPVYVKHQIVHNDYVVSSLEKMGAITVEEVDDIPIGSRVVFSAHGSPPKDYESAANRKLDVIDATCPLVTKVHKEAVRYESQQRRIIMIGHKGHQEVRGTMGQVPMVLMDDREKSRLPAWDKDTPISILTQTTLSVDDTAQAIKQVKNTFTNVEVRNDLCYATTNRQESVKKLSKLVDIIFVIGSKNSSNCNRLREVSESQGIPAYLINGPDKMKLEWLKGVSRGGITSGESTPERLVESVIDVIKPAEVTTLSGIDENVSFVLPKTLRE